MKNLKIAIASDHGGYELKKEIYEYLKKDYEIVDFGCNSVISCDYPFFAKKVCNEILKGNFERGILICGTGIGMQIAANRFKGIRAANVSESYSAKMSREHNNSNVLTLGARVIGRDLAFEIVDTWLKSEFLADRHLRRINMLDE